MALTLDITDLGEDGEGIARGEEAAGEDGIMRRPVYVVPGAVVGDVIAVTQSEWRGRSFEVSAFQLVTRSEERRDSFCRHTGCGGCALREYSLGGAAEAKRQRLQKTLEKALSHTVRVAPVVSDGALAYRHRVRLHAAGRRVGYRRARSHEVLPFIDCPVLEPPFAEALARAVEVLAKSGACFGELDAVYGQGLALQLIAERSKPDAPMLDALRRLVSEKIAQGATLTAEKKSRRIGEPQVVRAHPSFSGPARFALEPGVFSQANWAMNARLIAAVLAAVPATVSVVELHAGAGNFTLPLAARQKIWASEIAEMAVMCARRNAETHAVSPSIAICADKDAVALAPKADVLLVDPPRTGMKIVAGQLAQNPRFSRIVYVSCDAASLARDSQLLAPAYALTSVVPFDMFPGTPHIEALAIFERSAADF